MNEEAISTNNFEKSKQEKEKLLKQARTIQNVGNIIMMLGLVALILGGIFTATYVIVGGVVCILLGAFIQIFSTRKRKIANFIDLKPKETLVENNINKLQENSQNNQNNLQDLEQETENYEQLQEIKNTNQKQSNICAYCGATLTDGSKKCEYCGSEFWLVLKRI